MTGWDEIASAVAEFLLGEPIARTRREWRWGRKGSFSLNVEHGTWYDHEAGEGGGVLALVVRERGGSKADAVKWLRERSYLHRNGYRPRSPRDRPSRLKAVSKTDDWTRRLWAASRKVDGTAARAYLARRWCWPPDGLGPDLPPDVRWLPRENNPWLPVTAAGAVVFAYHRGGHSVGGAPVAVSLEALTDSGELMAPRWRRTYGTRRDAAFRPQPRPEAVSVVLVEGELDALAAVWLRLDGEVACCGGTSGMTHWEPATGDDRPVLVLPDGDKAGRDAARALRARLGRARVSVEWRRSGDEAEDLAVRLGERAAVIEYDGGLPREEAEQLAWKEWLCRT